MRGKTVLFLIGLLFFSVFYFPEVFSNSFNRVKVKYCELDISCLEKDSRLMILEESIKRSLTDFYIFFSADGNVIFEEKAVIPSGKNHLYGPWQFVSGKNKSLSKKPLRGKLVVSLNGFSEKDELLATWQFFSRSASGTFRPETIQLKDKFVPKSPNTNLGKFVAQNLAFVAMSFD